MSRRIPVLAAAVLLSLGAGLSRLSYAGDLKITLPKRSHLTPVQRLNREGVDAVNKRQFDNARALFYKAYLLDPGDPFTLNNLGYIAELEGQVERAQQFYALASSGATEARIDRASSSKLKGESLQGAIASVGDVPMRVNRANVKAVGLLSEGRVREADTLLQHTLSLDPRNGFTLNNMGVAKEAQGEYSEALSYYNRAAASHLEEPVVVTMSGAWRGKPLAEMARTSAARLRSRMKNLQSDDAKVALLNLRGVSAMNRNDWQSAQENFAQAYKLDPDNAFSLNNQGFMAEMSGDLESAEDFYRQARTAEGAGGRIGVATRPTAEGKRLSSVADESEGEVGSAIETASELRHRNPSGVIQLKHRDGSPVLPSSTTPEAVPPQDVPPPQEAAPQQVPPPQQQSAPQTEPPPQQ